jgi:hypothetical protein
MMNVTGEMKPCQRPRKNPAVRPSASAVLSRSFRPGAQPARSRVAMRIPVRTIERLMMSSLEMGVL